MKSAKSTRSLLDYAILGLVHGAPRTGYDIRKIFASSLLRLFSDSPGTVYPALRRLERSGLIEGRAPQGGRGRRAFRLTAKGRGEFRRWVATPIEAEELRKNPDAFSLQFAYMDGLVDPETIRGMLHDYAGAFSGLCRARIRWARRTIDEIGEST